MALFNKLFFSSSSKRKAFNTTNQSQNYLSNFPFDASQVRILLYRECDSRGRRLLFDSNAIQKVDLSTSTSQNDNMKRSMDSILTGNTSALAKYTKITKFSSPNTRRNSNSFIEISDGFGYKHGRPCAADITAIGEMVFGALALSFRGTALKVHWLQSPSRVLCSQVFLSPTRSSVGSAISRKVITTGNTSLSSMASSCSNLSENLSYSITEPESVSSFSMPFSISVQGHVINKMTELELAQVLQETQSGDNSFQSPALTTDSGFSSASFVRTDETHKNQQTMGKKQFWNSGNVPVHLPSNNSSNQYSIKNSGSGSILSDSESGRKLSIDSSIINGGDNPSTRSPKSSTNSCRSTSFSITTNTSYSNNLQRRISRNISTSFENPNSSSDFIGFVDDHYQTARSGGSDSCVTGNKNSPNDDVLASRSNPELGKRYHACNSGLTMNTGRRAKLGLAVCITMSEPYQKDMEQFCCEHIALLESMLCRLRASAENAYLNHRNFLQIMLHAWRNTAQWMVDFFSAPRLPYPVWLNINNFKDHAAEDHQSSFYITNREKYSKSAADIFMKELCWLLLVADTKDTNFFVSTVLTAILTHHLGWVSTVSALKTNGKSTAVEIINEQKSQLTELAQKHPYNVIWAQMSDLYGAVGNPAKVTRSIIYGNDNIYTEKLLNVLTYFIRCGEIRRSPKIEVLDKTNINEAIEAQLKAEELVKPKENQENKRNLSSSKIGGNLTRTRSCITNLSTTMTSFSNDKNFNNFACDLLDGKTIENPFNKIKVSESDDSKENQKILTPFLTLTTPENVELLVESTSDCNISIDKTTDKTDVSSTKDGIDWINIDLLKKGIKEINEKNLEVVVNWKNSAPSPPKSLVGDSETRTSLSDLITANSVGRSERFTWGIEPIKENICLEEEQHFEIGKKLVEKEKGLKTENGVVFVLGENEELVNIKKSNEDLPGLNNNDGKSENQINNLTSPNNLATKPPITGVALNPSQTGKTNSRTCRNHKKHSGVKFNFEQFPLIAENYMKSKNLDFSSYNFFLEKSSTSKLKTIDTITTFPLTLPSTTKSDDESCEEECEICSRRRSGILQTPSNATELDFEIDNDEGTFNKGLAGGTNFGVTNNKTLEITTTKSNIRPIDKQKDKEMKTKLLPLKELNFISLPFARVKDNEKEGSKPILTPNIQRFIPSLFVGISDHYISDMVLQGTTLSPENWEAKLKQDLILSSHSASLISTPSENIAVIADMEKWDVKTISSQAQGSPYFGGTCSGPVGMSQLVSTMLETVYAMSTSGISSLECLSYLESKLQEMYLQSELLASFLLATEFCSLNTVTAALNLSANDVPLLLSVASIHSPQVTKKYGISFR